MIAAFPGSFNPFHEGHMAIVKKMLPFVDKMYVLVMVNPKKFNKTELYNMTLLNNFQAVGKDNKPINQGSDKLEVVLYQGLLSDFCLKANVNVIINGLRNATDFEKAQRQLYWNQDLGLKIPVLNLIAERQYVHFNGESLRAVNRALKDKE